jgi:pimeloyl-ACP methyl ester carboxylesterase
MIANLGGVKHRETFRSLVVQMLARLVRSPHYSIGDIVGTIRGMSFVLDALLPDMAGLDLRTRLPLIEAPIFMCRGRLDRIEDPAATEQYFAALRAPRGKELVWFESSAHMPHVEEPAKFAEVVRRARAQSAAQ